MPKPTTPLTPDLHQEIVKRLRAGGFLEAVAREVGITSRLIRRWINKGSFEQDKRDRGAKPNTDFDPYVFFYMETASAMAEAEGRAVIKITQSDDWRAAAWYLERKFPRQWGKQLNLHLEQEYDAILNKLERLLPPDIYEDVLVAMATPDDLVDAVIEEDDEDGDVDAPED